MVPIIFPWFKISIKKGYFIAKKLQSNKFGMFPYIFSIFYSKNALFSSFFVSFNIFLHLFVFCSSTIRLFHFTATVHTKAVNYIFADVVVVVDVIGSYFFFSCVGNLSGFIERCVLCNICVIMFNMVKSWGVECVRAHVCVCMNSMVQHLCVHTE